MGTKVGDRAVVLGGSVAGLFAAWAVAEAYDEVLIVDRDTLIGVREPRKGAPQTRHINGLLARGHQALEEMFPGITEEMIAGGVPISDLSGTVRWYMNGKRLQQQRAGLSCVAATRPIMEYFMRERVRALPTVKFLERYDIVGVVTTSDNSRVTGVRVQSHAEGSAEEVLEADLVIDTTGRGSRAPVWLESWGYQRVEADEVKVGLGYASRHYRLRTDPFGSDHSINPVANATLPRGAIFTKTDSGKVELTIYGILGDHPPTDEDGFNAFAKTLAAPEIYETIIEAEPLDDIALYRFPTTMWRRYDQFDRLPGNFLMIGDSVCTPNPVYAQGQSLAALEALKLREYVDAGAAPDPLDFQRDVANIIAPVWHMTSSVDLSFPGVPGPRSQEVLEGQAFMRKLQEAAAKDGSITAAFMRVAGLVDPPEALQNPDLVARIFALADSQAA